MPVLGVILRLLRTNGSSALNRGWTKLGRKRRFPKPVTCGIRQISRVESADSRLQRLGGAFSQGAPGKLRGLSEGACAVLRGPIFAPCRCGCEAEGALETPIRSYSSPSSEDYGLQDSSRIAYVTGTSACRTIAVFPPLMPRYTPKQGQYLAFIYSYTKIHGRPPAQTDIQHYFKVTPPTVHQMVLKLDQLGLIERTPGQARSVRVLLLRQELPDLE